MTTLRVLKLAENVPLLAAMPVNMDEWAVSKADPLATVGAGPCMNVVVHDPKENLGGLTHLYNVAYNVDRIDFERSFQRHELYHKACFSVLEMMQRGLQTAGPFDIWLGAGGAFVSGSCFIKEDSVLYDFPEYITRFMLQANIQVAVTDNRQAKNSGDIIYWPPLAAVFFLVEQEDIFAVQTGKKAAISGVCR